MNNGKIIAYVRVSTLEQNTERQEQAINKAYKVDKMFLEKVSGKNTKDREQLNLMLDYVREGDTVVVSEYSRLARSTEDLLRISNLLEEKNVTLISLKEQIDTSTATGKLMLTVLSGIAQFEREIIKERQAEGIAIAKKKGKYKGGKKKEITDRFIRLYNNYKNREINKTQFAKEYNISRTTLNKMIDRYEEELNNN